MNKFEIQPSSNFRSLVGQLVEASPLFPPRIVGEDKKLTILDAIEGNEVTRYVPENADDRTLDAVDCLIAIYNELRKETPDNEFVTTTVDQLKDFL